MTQGRDEKRSPRVAGWIRRSAPSLVWLLPVAVVVVTAALGSTKNALLLSTWLAAVGAAAVGVLVHLSLEPAPYARRAAAAMAALGGIALLLTLTQLAGLPLLH